MKKEKNLMGDEELKTTLKEEASNVLVLNKLIEKNESLNTEINFGYVFLRENEKIEALFKINVKDNTFYFGCQDEKLMLLSTNEDMYNSIIENMYEMHECLKEKIEIDKEKNINIKDNFQNEENEDLDSKIEIEDTSIETEENKNIRINNYEFIKNQGITSIEYLKCLPSDDVPMKDIEKICTRAILSTLIASYACDLKRSIFKGRIKKTYEPIFNTYKDIMNFKNIKEQQLFDEVISGKYTEQNLIDLAWEYETGWSLLWALGLINDDINNASEICDTQKAFNIIINCNSFEDFKSKCKLRSRKEIKEKFDLYFRYHWVVVDRMINPNVSVGNLNYSIVIERRRGLEWIFSDEEDWYDISLDT